MTTFKIINLTPQPLNIYTRKWVYGCWDSKEDMENCGCPRCSANIEGGELVLIKTIPSTGLARVEEINIPANGCITGDANDSYCDRQNELGNCNPSCPHFEPLKIYGIPVVHKKFGGVTGVPPKQRGVKYFVSRKVLEALPRRNDLITGSKIVTDDNGMTIGYEEFSVL